MLHATSRRATAWGIAANAVLHREGSLGDDGPHRRHATRRDCGEVCDRIHGAVEDRRVRQQYSGVGDPLAPMPGPLCTHGRVEEDGDAAEEQRINHSLARNGVPRGLRPDARVVSGTCQARPCGRRVSGACQARVRRVAGTGQARGRHVAGTRQERVTSLVQCGLGMTQGTDLASKPSRPPGSHLQAERRTPVEARDSQQRRLGRVRGGDEPPPTTPFRSAPPLLPRRCDVGAT